MAKILIAEDELHIARVMSMWLNRHGHQTLETQNGLQALEALKDESVDLIITDMNMPELDGLGLIAAVREELHLEVPIILITARCDQVELKEKIRKHKVELFPKPFVPSRLVADIDRVLGVVSSPDMGT